MKCAASKEQEPKSTGSKEEEPTTEGSNTRSTDDEEQAEFLRKQEKKEKKQRKKKELEERIRKDVLQEVRREMQRKKRTGQSDDSVTEEASENDEAQVAKSTASSSSHGQAKKVSKTIAPKSVPAKLRSAAHKKEIDMQSPSSSKSKPDVKAGVKRKLGLAGGSASGKAKKAPEAHPAVSSRRRPWKASVLSRASELLSPAEGH